MKFILAALAFFAFATPAAAQRWIVAGDSIVTLATGGTPRDLQWSLITQERSVAFENIGSPGMTLGGPPLGGFNDPEIGETLDRMCGALSACTGLIVQVGVNDWAANVSMANINAGMDRFLNWASSRGKTVLMLDLIYYRDGELGAPVNAAGNTVSSIRLARALRCGAAGPSVCVFAGRPANFNVATAGYYQSDGTHLTPAGRRAYATWVESAASAAGLF